MLVFPGVFTFIFPFLWLRLRLSLVSSGSFLLGNIFAEFIGAGFGFYDVLIARIRECLL